MRRSGLLLILLILFSRIPAHALDSVQSPFHAVQEVVNNQEKESFEGVKVIAHWWEDSVSVQAVHIIKDRYRERYEYLPFENHPYQEAIINGRSIYYIKPSKNLAYRASFSFHGPKEKTVMDLAERNYTWKDEGVESVAGYDAHRISATPVDSSTPIVRFWVDENHHVILREERYFENTETIYFASYFSYITFPAALSDADFEVPLSYSLENVPSMQEMEGEDALKTLDFKPLQPRTLPPGFSLVGVYLTEWRSRSKLDLLYSDGLRDFSIYENLRKGPYHELKGSQIVFLNGHYVELLVRPEGRIIRFAQGPLTLAVIGTLPQNTLADVALATATPIAMRPPGPIHRVAHYFVRGLQTIERLLSFRE